MSELTNTPKMDPGLFSYLKTLLPMLDDKGAVDLYESTKAAAAKQGVDIGAQPPAVVAKMVKQVIDASASAQKPAQTPPLVPAITPPAPVAADPQTINITGQRLPPTKAVGGNFGTGPQGVVAGTQATDAQFGAPGATSARLNASADPAEMEAAARERYRLQGGNSLLQRFTGGMQAATGALVGNAGGYQEYQKRLNDIDTAFTTGLVDAKQAAHLKALAEARAGATAAQVNAAGAQKQAQDAAQFGAEQVGRNNAAALSNQGTSAALELGDPESSTSKAALQQASPMLKSLGIDPQHFAGMPATAIIAFIANTKPVTELQNQLKTQFQKDFELDTGRIGALAGVNVSGAQAAQVRQGTAQGGQIFNQYQQGTLPQQAGNNTSVNLGPNGVAINSAPSPATTGVQAGGAEAVNTLRKSTSLYDTNGVGPATDTALKSLGIASFKDTGVPGAFLKRIPGVQAQSIKVALTGQIMAANPGMDANAAADNAETVMRSGTPSMLIQQLSRGKATQAGNRKHVLPAQEEYLRKNGSLTGFTPPTVTSFYNPKTGAVATSTDWKAGDAPPKDFILITGGNK